MAEMLQFRKNGLNLFRFLAALQVLQGHAVAHLSLQRVPVLSDIIAFFSGVPIFFTLSGFLIWKSIGRSTSFGDYAQKRFWRIFPELWVAVAVEIVVLLLLYHHPIDFHNLGLFAIGQATVFQFWTPDFLREYGCGTPNGALWTITVLIQFYLCAYFVYKFLCDKKIIVWGGVMLASVVLGWSTPILSKALPEVVGKLYSISLFPYLWMFLFSAFASEYSKKFLPFVKKYWLLFIVVLLIQRYLFHWDIAIHSYSLFDTVLLFCGIVGFAYAFPQINLKTDISYGIYIYHMTVVNALIALGFVGHNWTYWTVIVITCFLAWVSTKTVGQLSMNKKK